MTAKRLVLVLVLLAVTGLGLSVAGAYGWAEYHFRRARAETALQHHARAYHHLTQALRVWPRSAPTHLLAARAARRAGLLKEAGHHVKESQRLYGQAPEDLRLEIALLQTQAGEAAWLADQLWARVAADDSDKVLILEALTAGYVLQPGPPAGLRAVNQLLALEPDNVIGRYGRGVLLELEGKQDSALPEYRRVVELDPDRDDARRRLAELLRTRKPREALDHFEHLRQRHPEDASLELSVALAHKAAGESGEAARRLDAFLAGHPEDVGALTERGLLAVQTGAAAQGEAWLRQAVHLHPASLDAQYHLYECLVQQPGKAEAAARQRAAFERVRAEAAHLEELLTTKRAEILRSAALLHELGTLLLRARRDEEALRALHGALDLDPTYAPAHRTLADYYQDHGQKKRAAEHRRSAGE